MDLSTIGRVKRLLKTSDVDNDALLRQLISGISGTIENYLARPLLRTARTEQYTITPGTQQVFLKAYPVKDTPAPQFRNSIIRDFASAVLVDPAMYYIENDIGRVYFDRIALIYGQGVLQAVYTGGMADTGVTLVAASSSLSIGNTIAIGNLVIGATSGARGVLNTVPGNPGSVSLDVESGVFVAGETINCYVGTWESLGATSGSFTLGAFTSEPMAHLFPEIVEAFEAQVSFEFMRKDTIGVSGYSAEGGSVSMDPAQRLLPGVKDILKARRNRVLRGIS